MNFNSPKTNLNFHIINKNNIYQHPKSKLQSDNLTSTKIASRNIIYTNMKNQFYKKITTSFTLHFPVQFNSALWLACKTDDSFGNFQCSIGVL